ncbi:MAG: hypothetical protein IPI46_07425 [Bacteroidetes bacterium]|nr:hypothetical protein [Bacteroidota bacterium]
MPEVFTFIIQNSKQAKYYKQGRAMHIMAGIVLFCYALPYVINIQKEWMMPVAILLPVITILMVSLFKPILIRDVGNNRVFRILEAGFLMMGSMHYLQIDQIFPAILFSLVSFIMLLLLKLESRIFQIQYVYIHEKGIEIDMPLSTKSLAWMQIDKLILKHDYLSLIVLNQSSLQIQVKHKMSEVEVMAFENYVQRKLNNKV